MSTLREAAQEALFWMQHARLHLTIKERLHPDGMIQYDNAFRNLRAALAQPKTELRDQHKAFAKWFLTQNPIAPSPEDMAWAAWKAALAEPKTELRDQHKAFTHWYFGLRGINEANFNPEYLAWAAWKAALAAPENRPCTCHPDDNPPQPCAQRYALTECKTFAQPETAATKEDLRIYDAIAENYAHPPRDEWRLVSEPPEGSKPHAYLMEKLAMVMPLFQEARDALTAITEQQRIARGISPTLADRMDAAGTYSVDDWRDVQPPTEGKR